MARIKIENIEGSQALSKSDMANVYGGFSLQSTFGFTSASNLRPVSSFKGGFSIPPSGIAGQACWSSQSVDDKYEQVANSCGETGDTGMMGCPG